MAIAYVMTRGCPSLSLPNSRIVFCLSTELTQPVHAISCEAESTVAMNRVESFLDIHLLLVKREFDYTIYGLLFFLYRFST